MEWDIESGKKLQSLDGHNGDVVAVSLRPDEGGDDAESGSSIFLTASVDRTARIWDLRAGACQQVFWGHEADVNSACFHPDGRHFVTCSEDKTCRLWDLRADQEIAVYKAPPNHASSTFTSCGLSKSGRLVFCGSDDSSIHMWDVVGKQPHGLLSGHENRVTQISVAPSGIALASASWDSAVRIWAL